MDNITTDFTESNFPDLREEPGSVTDAQKVRTKKAFLAEAIEAKPVEPKPVTPTLTRAVMVEEQIASYGRYDAENFTLLFHSRPEYFLWREWVIQTPGEKKKSDYAFMPREHEPLEDVVRRAQTGKGLPPVLSPHLKDNTFHWFAVDVDVYGLSNKSQHYAQVLGKKNLFVSISKSGGLHLFGFLSTNVDLEQGFPVLQRLSPYLWTGFGEQHELFPRKKKVAESSKPPALNIPYTAHQDYPGAFRTILHPETGQPMPLSEFLAVAGERQLSREQFLALDLKDIEQELHACEDFYGAPHCVIEPLLRDVLAYREATETRQQEMLQQGSMWAREPGAGIAESGNPGRDTWLANVAIYLTKRHGEATLEQLEYYNRTYCSDPLTHSEVRSKAGVKEYSGYNCGGCSAKGFCGKVRFGFNQEKWFAKSEATAKESEAGGKGKGKESEALQLANLVEQQCEELWLREDDGSVWVTFAVKDHLEHWQVDQGPVEDWCRNSYEAAFNKPLTKQSISDALATVSARVRQSDKCHPVYKFICLDKESKKYYLDLRNKAWQAVEIDETGWRVVTSPVRFYRSTDTAPLPLPEEGGSLEDLRPLCNVKTSNDWIRLKAWLFDTLKPSSPYYLLGCIAEPGAAKTTLGRILSHLIDPRSTNELTAVVGLPKDRQGLATVAAKGHVICFDNISYLSAEQSDALCQVATRFEEKTRKLYTNTDVVTIRTANPVILNGITDFATRSDLLSRLISIDMRPIPGEKRLKEHTNRFHDDEPTIFSMVSGVRGSVLGALCSAVSQALGFRGSLQAGERVRMVDSADWIVAGCSGLGFTREEFAAALKEQQANHDATEIESSLLATLLLKDDHTEFSNGDIEGPIFTEQGSRVLDSYTLSHELKKRARDRSEENALPQNVKALGRQLAFLLPTLKRQGLIVTSKPTKTGKLYHVYRANADQAGEYLMDARRFTGQWHSPAIAPDPVTGQPDWEKVWNPELVHRNGVGGYEFDTGVKVRLPGPVVIQEPEGSRVASPDLPGWKPCLTEEERVKNRGWATMEERKALMDSRRAARAPESKAVAANAARQARHRAKVRGTVGQLSEANTGEF